MDALVRLLLIIVFGYAALYTLFGLIGVGNSLVKSKRKWLVRLSFLITLFVILAMTGFIHVSGFNPVIIFNGSNTEKKTLFTVGFGVVVYTVLYYYFKLVSFLVSKLFNGK